MTFDPRKYREEKEKEISQTYGNMRKRSFKFLFLNIFIVLMVFVFLFFVRNISPRLYSNIADSLQLTIELNKLEYSAPEKVGARVYVVNTKRTDKNFVVSEFYFQLSNDKRTIYDFNYQSAVEGVAPALGKRLLFNLEDQVSVSNLENGTYYVYARCKINGKPVEIKRSFNYTEEIFYGILTQQFYLVGEEIQPSLIIVNRTAKTQELKLERIVWTYKDDKMTQNLSEMVRIHPGQFATFQFERRFKVLDLGNAELSAQVYFDDGSIKEVKILVPTVKDYERNPKDLDFSIETLESVVINKSADIQVFLINKINRERFIKYDSVQFSIPEIGYNFELRNRRLYAFPFGKTLIGKLERLSFTKPGVYNLIITFKAENAKLEKKIAVAVGK
ncbi:MAG: hypothetical protein WHS64_06000 [Fervidobacterium sp.]|uniref:Uncharacterized protein n=1 Tax=Fervidobacterium gondwanense DSM 13020 TaxID=1121883 RepID=A0A1M7SFA8_FERGO|nr:hypothetical protein [Fervidobacterium gondwanense]UXF01145.1 hypothetical protein IB67_06225 [Fervidobacterium riparium]SHN57110.1 hypothetical protein SAMN02745226_00850 [Fervidobacterium gondwanense DSM 13020]